MLCRLRLWEQRWQQRHLLYCDNRLHQVWLNEARTQVISFDSQNCVFCFVFFSMEVHYFVSCNTEYNSDDNSWCIHTFMYWPQSPSLVNCMNPNVIRFLGTLHEISLPDRYLIITFRQTCFQYTILYTYILQYDVISTWHIQRLKTSTEVKSHVVGCCIRWHYCTVVYSRCVGCADMLLDTTVLPNQCPQDVHVLFAFLHLTISKI